MILEMFYWAEPKGLKTFGITKEFALASKVLASNQGLYNGFLSAGLIWSLVDQVYANQIAIFFLTCVIIAGIFGSYSTKKAKLFYIQSIPALISLCFVLINIIKYT
jgi:putative membrane protein